MRFPGFTYFRHQNFEKLMQRFVAVDYFNVEILNEDEIMCNSAREFIDGKNIPIIENITAEIYSRLKQGLFSSACSSEN